MIVYNALWTVDSVLILAAGWIASALGYAFVLARAVVVAVFAELQYFALRRSGDGGRVIG